MSHASTHATAFRLRLRESSGLVITVAIHAAIGAAVLIGFNIARTTPHRDRRSSPRTSPTPSSRCSRPIR